MDSEDRFLLELKILLTTRTRQGGDLYVIYKKAFPSVYQENLSSYMTSSVLNMVGKLNYCYIPEESKSDKLVFLDVARGVRVNGDSVEILGYFYDGGRVISYVIDTFNKVTDNNG